MERPDVLVVGGGLSGLAAAARLALGGVHVVVLEANARLGGALAGCPIGRYRLEIGPSWIEDRPRLASAFEKLDMDLASSVEMIRLDPALRFQFDKDRALTLPADLEAAIDAVEAMFPGEGQGYRDLIQSYPELVEMPTVDAPSLEAVVREKIRSEELREVFYSFGHLHGIEPEAVPASEMNLARAHHDGFYVPKGGFDKLAIALAKVARAAGVQFVMGARVAELLVEDGRAGGVFLVGGLRLKAKAVVATAPAASVLSEWLPSSVKSPLTSRILGMRLIAPPFLLQRSTQAPAQDLPYLTTVWRGNRNVDQDGATMQVVHSTSVDPSVVPDGRGLVKVSASLDYPAAGGSWGLRRKALGKAVAHRLQAVLGDQISLDEEVHRFHDPELLGAVLRLSTRALYPAVTRWQIGDGRVPYRPNAPEGLYLAGSWTTSGPGVGATVEGGVAAADLVLEDLKAS